MEAELSSLPRRSGVTSRDTSCHMFSQEDMFWEGFMSQHPRPVGTSNDQRSPVGTPDEAVPLECSGGSVSEELCSTLAEIAAAVNGQRPRDAVPCATGSEPRKRARKRDRDKNWTEDETAVLVECKRSAFHDKGSPFRKAKSSATNWGAISHELRTNSDTRASEKSGDQCRLRWDTLVKSHRKIKKRCLQKNKGYAELTEEEMSELKLATTLDEGWYEVIDTISPMSQKGGGKLSTPIAGDSLNPESRLENNPLTVSSLNGRTDSRLYRLFPDGRFLVGAHNYPCSIICAHDPTERPDPRESSRKQIAIPGFSSMDVKLRATLLDLIFGARFLKYRCLAGDFSTEEDENLSFSCRWLSVVQNRSCSEIYNDVNKLVKTKLVHISEDFAGRVSINQSRFRVFNIFVKKVILKNPKYDTHWRIGYQTMSSLEASSLPQHITVLQLEGCEELKTANFRGLRKLRSLSIFYCQKLVEVTGWKFLRELGWLDIDGCISYLDYPDLHDLPSLREFRFTRDGLIQCPRKSELGMSRCVRLRRLKIWCDDGLEGSGDLSSLKCLETLSFEGCFALTNISGLSGLHLLTSLSLKDCAAMQSLPDIGHMKELVYVDIRETNLEEIPGVEKLVSLKKMDCRWSKVKRLPDLHHLPELLKVLLKGTALIEDDPSSFYFDKEEVFFNTEERGHVDVSDISDTEYNASDTEASWSDDSLSCDDAD